MKALERGDIDTMLSTFHRDVSLTFGGDTVLGARDVRGPAVRAWFELFVKLIPNPKFSIQRLAVSGPPWNTQIAAYVHIRSEVGGWPYQNEFGHFIRVRWGKVVEDIIVEDTQRLVAALGSAAGAAVGKPSRSPARAHDGRPDLGEV